MKSESPENPPRWLEVMIEKHSECETIEEFLDADNPRFARADIVGKRITITSVRTRQSDHINDTYAVIGFTSESLGPGQFKIGGLAGRQAMHMRKRLPVDTVLRCYTAASGREYYKWSTTE